MLPIENNKHHNFEWRGQGRAVDSFALWSYPIWVQCLNNFVADCVYQDLRQTHHDWPVIKAIADFPSRLKGYSTLISSNLLSPLGPQNKDIGSASQTLLTRIRLCLWRGLSVTCSNIFTVCLRNLLAACTLGIIMDAHCSGGFLYIHVSAKYKSHKRKVKRKKKCQDLVKLCVSRWGRGAVVVQKRHLCDWWVSWMLDEVKHETMLASGLHH